MSPKRRYMAIKFHSIRVTEAGNRFFFLNFVVHNIRSTYFPRHCRCFTVPSDVFDCTVL